MFNRRYKLVTHVVVGGKRLEKKIFFLHDTLFDFDRLLDY